MPFADFALALTRQFGLDSPEGGFAKGCHFQFDAVEVQVTEVPGEELILLRSELGALRGAGLEGQLEELLLGNLFTNPSGEGVLGVEPGGSVVMKQRVAIGHLPTAAAASIVARFAGHAAVWQAQLRTRLGPSRHLSPLDSAAMEVPHERA